MKNGLEKRTDHFVERIRREDVNLHGFILSVNGREKVKAYYEPFREGEPHRMYSVSKTMTACAVGMLMDEGKVGLDDHITDYFQDLFPDQVSPYLQHQTLRDMLRMATCYRQTAYRGYVDERAVGFISGTYSIEDEFDSYIAALQGLQVEELLKVKQAQYDRFAAAK